MNFISTIEDWDGLIASEAIFTNKRIVLGGKTITIQGFASSWITFENCSFECSNLHFLNINNPDQRVEFNNCTFDCNVNVTNCIMEHFEFLNTVSIKSLNIEKGLHEFCRLEMNYFGFINKPDSNTNDLNTLFTFNKCNFDKFAFEGIKHIGGRFKFIENILGKKENTIAHLSFENSQILNGYFSRNKFEQITSFYNCSFSYNKKDLENAGYKSTKFYRNTFDKVNFTESNFVNQCIFDKCDFESTTWFEHCQNIETAQLKLIACKFDGYALFDFSNFSNFEIIHTTFERKVSFNQLSVNTIKLHQVTFNKAAYFDEIKILTVKDKSYLKKASVFSLLEWKYTLRIIKQEFQRTENKIDFNRFRNYELAAHYKELKWKDNIIDKFILFATKWSTNFGSWMWALCFTIISGFFWYCILYFHEFYVVLNFNNNQSFITGAFRFFLVTDFFSPFLDRQYLNNGYSWTIFFIGKIFIAFGIYEMIQAFRKFKS